MFGKILTMISCKNFLYNKGKKYIDFILSCTYYCTILEKDNCIEYSLYTTYSNAVIDLGNIDCTNLSSIIAKSVVDTHSESSPGYQEFEFICDNKSLMKTSDRIFNQHIYFGIDVSELVGMHSIKIQISSARGNGTGRVEEIWTEKNSGGGLKTLFKKAIKTLFKKKGVGLNVWKNFSK